MYKIPPKNLMSENESHLFNNDIFTQGFEFKRQISLWWGNLPFRSLADIMNFEMCMIFFHK